MGYNFSSEAITREWDRCTRSLELQIKIKVQIKNNFWFEGEIKVAWRGWLCTFPRLAHPISLDGIWRKEDV
jgi:hypothetical protein